ASANAQLANKISELGGVPDIVTRDRANSIAISLSMSVPGYAPLNYQLEVALKGFTYEIALETLTQQNNRHALEPLKYIESRGLDVIYFNTEDRALLRPNWDHNPLETSLAQVPKMYQEPEKLRKRLASCTFYGALNVAPKSPVRLPQSMRPASLPGANGED
ncbi:MAG: ABC transporter ATP-binding protein, partial [Anabaena sp. CRKS33]